MKHLTILVPEGEHNLSSIVGSYKIFTRANEYLQAGGKEPVFKIELAGASKNIKFHDGIFWVQPHCLIDDIVHTDLVIIPALKKTGFAEVADKNNRMISWIREQHTKGAEIASMCTGAFLLASSGLVDGKECSTHWGVGETFSQMFPKVKFVTDRLITDEDGIYTNGGAFSFLHLVLYLVEKYYGRQVAIYCSKVFQVDMDRHSQSPFIIFSGQKAHEDELVKKAQEYIENNSTEKISVDQLASMLSVGRRHFDRRFKLATGNTPLEYLQRVKVEVAKKSFETTRKNIQEVMFDVGYADVKAFREVFRKITGLSPLEYRNKYNKVTAPSVY